MTIEKYDTTYTGYSEENTRQHNISRNYSILSNDERGFFIEIQLLNHSILIKLKNRRTVCIKCTSK